MRVTDSLVAVKVSRPSIADLTVKVTTPLPLLTLLLVVMLALPFPARETTLPGSGRPPEFLTVTVMVEVSVLSARMAAGEAETVELAASTAADWNSTLAVWVTTTLSVTEVAVNPFVPTVFELTVKVATPRPFVVWAPAGPIAGVPGPEVFAKVTPSPGTGLLPASLRVTVTIEVAVPSARTAAGDDATVEVAASTGLAGPEATVPEMAMLSRYKRLPPALLAIRKVAFSPGAKVRSDSMSDSANSKP